MPALAPAPFPWLSSLLDVDDTPVVPGRLDAAMFVGQMYAPTLYLGQLWGRSRTVSGGGGGGGGSGDGWTRVTRDTQTWVEV